MDARDLRTSGFADSTVFRLRLTAVLLHTLLFAATWITYWLQKVPLADGPAFWPFSVLLFADLPVSVLAGGMLWSEGKNSFQYGLVTWGVLGTLWWYWLVGKISKRADRSSGS